MEEWQRTLFTAGVGFLAGLLAEPLKHTLAESQKRRRIKRAIYREVVTNMATLRLTQQFREAIPNNDEDLAVWAAVGLGSISTDIYDHFWKSDPSTLVEITGAGAIREFAEKVRAIIELMKSNAPIPELLDAVRKALFVATTSEELGLFSGLYLWWFRNRPSMKRRRVAKNFNRRVAERRAQKIAALLRERTSIPLQSRDSEPPPGVSPRR